MLAERYWRIVPELDPGSLWARRVERFLPYLITLRTREVPAFEADFSLAGGTPVRKGKKEIEGRHAILHFWSAAAGGAREAALEIEKIRARFAEGGLLVLGINLDQNREVFINGARAHGVARLETHDGSAFEGPLARAIGIPRVPHFLVIAPGGEALYLGGDLEQVKKVLRPRPVKKKN